MKPCSLVLRFLTFSTMLVQGSVFTFGAPTDTGSRQLATLPANQTDLARIEMFTNVFTRGLLAGDLSPAEAYYDEDLRLMPSYQKTMLGRADAQLYYRAFLSRFEIKAYGREKPEVLDLGSKVAEFGEFSLTVVLKSSGKVENLHGKYMDLWEKTPGGVPRLITSAWNYDRQAEDGDAFRFNEVPSVLTALQPHLVVNNPIRFELAALNLFIEAIVAQHDAKLWSQLYADDAVLSPNLAPTARGRVEIDRYLEAHVKQLPIFEHLDIRNDRVDVSGTYVVEYASHTAHWRSGESSGVGTGKDLRLWRREPDGSLKLVRQIGSYD